MALPAPVTDVSFAGAAETLSGLATASPTTHPASSAPQWASQLLDSTVIALAGGVASTTLPTPADLLFQGGFTDLYAGEFNNALFANPLQASPPQSASPIQAAAPTALSINASGSTTPAITPSAPIDSAAASPTTPPPDSGGGYDPYPSSPYVITNYSNTQTGGGTTTTYGMDANGGVTTTVSTDAWTRTITSSADGRIIQETDADAYDVSITSSDVGGLTQHDWGTSSSITTGDSGPDQTTYTIVSTDTADETGSQTLTDSAGSTTAQTWHSHQHDDGNVNDVSNAVTGVETDASSGSGSASTGSTFTATFVQSINGGTINVTDSGGGSDASSYQFATTQSVGASGAFTSSGTLGGTTSSTSHDAYSGSGSYVVGANSTASDGTTFTGNGTVTMSGSDSSTGAYNSNYTLGNDGSWQATGGGGSSSGGGSANDGSTYVGTYVQPITGGTINGTNSSSASDASTYQYATSQNVDAYGASTSGGTLGQTLNSSSQGNYAGSGSYVLGADSASTGSDGATTTGGGTVTTSASDHATSVYNSNYTLGNDGSWQASNGSGSSSGGSLTQSSFNGSGGYSGPIDGGGAQGTWNESGSAGTNNATQTVSALNPDGTWTTTGSQDASGNGSRNFLYSGAGSYILVTGASSSGTVITGGGTTTESGADAGSYSYDGHFTLDAQGLLHVGSGSATSDSNGSAHSTYSGSGGYTRPLNYGILQGTWQQGGNGDSSFDKNTTTTLDASGVGTTTGSDANSNSDAGNWSFVGAGSDTSSGSSATENASAHWSNQVVTGAALAADGSITTTAAATASGGTSAGYTYAANGGSVAESGAQNWQAGSTINSGPGGATLTASTSRDSHSSGDTSGNGGEDHYNDHANASQGISADGTQTGDSTAVNHVWGGGYDQNVAYLGFFLGANGGTALLGGGVFAAPGQAGPAAAPADPNANPLKGLNEGDLAAALNKARKGPLGPLTANDIIDIYQDASTSADNKKAALEALKAHSKEFLKAVRGYFFAQPPAGHAVDKATQDAIDQAIRKLGDDEFTVREAASEKLRKFGPAAIGALLKAMKSDDAEVAHRAKLLVDALSVPPSLLEATQLELVALIRAAGNKPSDLAAEAALLLEIASLPMDSPVRRAATVAYDQVRKLLHDLDNPEGP